MVTPPEDLTRSRTVRRARTACRQRQDGTRCVPYELCVFAALRETSSVIPARLHPAAADRMMTVPPRRRPAMKTLPLAAALALLAVHPPAAAQDPPGPADLIVHKAKVVTVDDKF